VVEQAAVEQAAVEQEAVDKTIPRATRRV